MLQQGFKILQGKIKMLARVVEQIFPSTLRPFLTHFLDWSKFFPQKSAIVGSVVDR
jgi:hypothetical protein